MCVSWSHLPCGTMRSANHSILVTWPVSANVITLIQHGVLHVLFFVLASLSSCLLGIPHSFLISLAEMRDVPIGHATASVCPFCESISLMHCRSYLALFIWRPPCRCQLGCVITVTAVFLRNSFYLGTNQVSSMHTISRLSSVMAIPCECHTCASRNKVT